MTGRGQLQHHFWGTYSASIVLQFATPEDARIAEQEAFHMFHQHPTEPRALVFYGAETALKAAESALRSHGADMSKVQSLARSIDYGEPFTVEVTLSDGSQQLTLLGE